MNSIENFFLLAHETCFCIERNFFFIFLGIYNTRLSVCVDENYHMKTENILSLCRTIFASLWNFGFLRTTISVMRHQRFLYAGWSEGIIIKSHFPPCSCEVHELTKIICFPKNGNCWMRLFRTEK